MVSDNGSNVRMLKESYPRYGFEALSMLIESGWDALCITRLHPDYVRQKFGLGSTKCLWLSSRKGEDCLSPKSMSHLVREIKGHLSGEGNTVVFLDGMEYLLLWNAMSKVLSTLKEIDSLMSKENGEMLMCIDPLTLEKKDLDRLDRFPHHSAYEVVEILSSRLPQQTAGDVPGTAGQRVADLLRSEELPAAP